MTLPKTAWPISAGSTLARTIASRAAKTVRSMALMSFSVPPKVPNGVRSALRKTISLFITPGEFGGP